MTKHLLACLFFFLICPWAIKAQDEPPIEEEGEEEVDYANLVQTMENKAFATSRIVGQLPVKIFSLGYDLQTRHTLEPAAFAPGMAAGESTINSARGLRLGINYPVYSKNNFLLNLGLNYAATQYSFTQNTTMASHPLAQALENNGLKTLGFTATGFKPLDSRRYLIFQFGANLNGDYSFSNMQSLKYTRYSGAAIYGIKANERKMWGLGISRTYLGGSLNYLPVYYMLYTAKNEKWGLEMLLPARFQYRRNINDKNLLTMGWEIEGNTYRINNDQNQYNLPYNDMELRRSELRFRMGWEHALSNQIWLSAQAGYRYNWSFDLDRGDFFRPFGDDTPFLAENDLGNPAYFNLSLNWVSP
ncbi:hypothetical protein [Maribacter sp. 2307ULW6-5]|uniref:hypothetical protein n=1 Tax=Maribacter sp. 2307ULW6-5 TaxID=3386275 RepID=UPI0039BCE55F